MSKSANVYKLLTTKVLFIHKIIVNYKQTRGLNDKNEKESEIYWSLKD